MSGAGRFDEWGLRAAEQLESSVGPWVALASYKRLLEAAPPIATRAVLGAMRCAAALEDHAELDLLVVRWSSADRELATGLPLALARAELARGRPASAVALAEAEVARRPTASSAYAAARVADAAQLGDPSAALARAGALARVEGDARIATACTAGQLERLEDEVQHTPGAPYRTRALALVEAADPDLASGAAAWWIARARLLAPGRFVRAGAISALGTLVASSTPLARPAAAAIGRHVDAMGARLTAIEGERAHAGLRALPEGPVRDAALARLAAVRDLAGRRPGADRDAAALAAATVDASTAEAAARARALDEGPTSIRFGRERFVDPFARLAALGLEALAALRQGRSEAAAEALGTAWRAVGPGDAAPAPLWTAAEEGLGHRGAVRSASARLGAALITRAGGEPPRGFHRFGAALAVAGATDVALEALRHAVRAREDGAAEDLARTATAAAWAAYERGHTERAHALLGEARRAASP